jgi:hypothetical protein
MPPLDPPLSRADFLPGGRANAEIGALEQRIASAIARTNDPDERRTVMRREVVTTLVALGLTDADLAAMRLDLAEAQGLAELARLTRRLA